MCILITDETYDIHCPTDTGGKLLSTAIYVVVVAVVALFTRAFVYILRDGWGMVNGMGYDGMGSVLLCLMSQLSLYLSNALCCVSFIKLRCLVSSQ